MASSNPSARGRKVIPQKHASKAPVPAIPLPYVKRQAAAAAAAAASPTSANFTSANPASELIPQLENLRTNGTATEGAGKTATAASTNAEPSQPQASTKDAKVVKANGNHNKAGQGNRKKTSISERKLATNKSPAVTEPITSDTTDEKPAADVLPKPALVANGHTSPTVQTQSKVEPSVAEPFNMPIPHPSSPQAFQIPPAFQPAGPMGGVPNGSMPRAPPYPVANGTMHMHQPHPSNGSVQFGAFGGSSTSSPAPPHSGGFMPPPGMPMPDGQPSFMAMNGQHPIMPFPAMVAGHHYNGPVSPYPPLDGHPDHGNNFGHTTPHSFNGSQSSLNPEDHGNGPYGHFPPGINRNGVGHIVEEAPLRGQHDRIGGWQGHARVMSAPRMPLPILPDASDGHALLNYIGSLFASPERADCMLELRYLDDHAPPFRMPGHQVILARSPAVDEVLSQHGLQPDPMNRSLRLVQLKTDNKWIQPEAFHIAVQQLYSLPLLPRPPPSNPHERASFSVGDRLNFALAYAAAGHILGWGPVVQRGCDIAASLMDWSNIEKCLEFALEGYAERASYTEFKYRGGSMMLLGAAASYIVHNMPRQISLDTSVEDPKTFARLPVTLPPARKSQVKKKGDMPVIAQGSAAHLNGASTRRLSGIRFGDPSLHTDDDAVGAEADKNVNSTLQKSLSRILLNLPFAQLKMLLESDGAVEADGRISIEARHRIIKDVVVEREARRLRALNVLKDGSIPNAEAIRSRLRAPEPRDLDEWSVLSWREEMVHHANAEGPSLGRTWAPLTDVPATVAATSYV